MEEGGAESRYAAMMERLVALEKQRLLHAETRRQDAAQSANPLESPGAFQAQFQQQLHNVEQSLLGLTSATGSSTKPELDSIAIALASLDKMVSDASYFLPPYDLQSSRSAIEKLKLKLDSTHSELLPKKKFSFRNKNPVTPTPNPVAPTPNPVSEEVNVPRFSGKLECISDKKNATIVHDSGETGDAEVMISGLSQCSVFLRGRFRALFFHKLTGCHVYVGAVSGSIMVEEAEGCIFMLASHQIRIHSTRDSDFYLRVRSRPIVEYVSGVRFAPYAFEYEAIEGDLRALNLVEETGLWDKVDDFRWLRASASPNWSVIPPEQRIPLVNGSAVSSREFEN